MTTSVLSAALSRRFWAGLALLSILSLAACQTNVPARPKSEAMPTDSVQTQNDDPPVDPSGPGGRK